MVTVPSIDDLIEVVIASVVTNLQQAFRRFDQRLTNALDRAWSLWFRLPPDFRGGAALLGVLASDAFDGLVGDVRTALSGSIVQSIAQTLVGIVLAQALPSRVITYRKAVTLLITSTAQAAQEASNLPGLVQFNWLKRLKTIVGFGGTFTNPLLKTIAKKFWSYALQTLVNSLAATWNLFSTLFTVVLFWRLWSEFRTGNWLANCLPQTAPRQKWKVSSPSKLTIRRRTPGGAVP